MRKAFEFLGSMGVGGKRAAGSAELRGAARLHTLSDVLDTRGRRSGRARYFRRDAPVATRSTSQAG
jgi:hypothetical protein